MTLQLGDAVYDFEVQRGVSILTLYNIPSIVRDTVLVLDDVIFGGYHYRGSNLLVDLDKEPNEYSTKAVRQIVDYLVGAYRKGYIGPKVAVLVRNQKHQQMMSVANHLSCEDDLMIIPFAAEERERALDFASSNDLILAWKEDLACERGELVFNFLIEDGIGVVQIEEVPKPFLVSDILAIFERWNEFCQERRHFLVQLPDYTPTRSNYAQWEITEAILGVKSKLPMGDTKGRLAILIANNAQRASIGTLFAFLMQSGLLEPGMFMISERDQAKRFLLGEMSVEEPIESFWRN